MHDHRPHDHDHDHEHQHERAAEPSAEEIRVARATSYALGEMGAAARAAFEAEMKQDPALAREVASIRAMAGDLESAFAADAAGVGLTASQRARVTDPVAADEERGPIRITPWLAGWSRFAWGAGAIAACGAIAFVMLRTRSEPAIGGPNEGGIAMETDRETAARSLDDARMSGRIAGGQAPSAVAGDSSGPAGGLTNRFEPGRAAGGPGGASEDRIQSFSADDVLDGVAVEPPRLMLYSVAAEPAADAGGSRTEPSPSAAPLLPAAARVRFEAAPETIAPVRAPSELDPRDWSERPVPPGGREAYGALVDNPFRSPFDAPYSTFSIDVDTASYSNLRRMLDRGTLPPKDAIRIEELVNYFDYDYPAPSGDEPLGVSIDAGAAPWAPEHRLVRIAMRARELAPRQEVFVLPSEPDGAITTAVHDAPGVRPKANLVFLVDVSGSMNQDDKLPLVKASLRMLVDALAPDDRIALVVYAGASGLVLDSTPVGERETILGALDRLSAGGSTNGGAGLELAYDVARRHFIDGGANRVILCTDGDFNVGPAGPDALQALIEEKRRTDVFLSVLGFGTGNWQDDSMERLSNHGNGIAAYIDSVHEARRVLVDRLGSSLVTVAKDVKLQVEFNPARVQAYRLIGYANRILRDRDFNDDTVDAGDVGAGHVVTALYEVVPPGVEWRSEVDDPKYQRPAEPQAPRPEVIDSSELLTVKLRWKAPDEDESVLREFPFEDDGDAPADDDFRFAAGVAAFGMVLRDSPYRGDADLDLARALVADSIGRDPGGWRAEFLRLVDTARSLKD